MQVISNRLDLDAFFLGLAKSQRSLILLDYDGTLAPFREQRDQAFPYPGVVERLKRLVACPGTRVVIISGRWSLDLLPLLGMETPPEIWGCHGIERPDGSIRELGRLAASSLEQAVTWARLNGLSEHSERKPANLAFHWRGLSDKEATRLRSLVIGQWPLDTEVGGLVLREFDGGLELRPTGLGKGGAVREILAEIDSASPVAYLGDDLTDEDAFEALGDRGLKVLVRGESRNTRADVRIEPPEELLAFLDRWLHDQK